MPKPLSVPSYRLHKQSGQAVVTLRDHLSGRRKDVLLGAYGTVDSRTEFARVIGEWEAAGRRILDQKAVADLTIAELILAYWPHVESHYRGPDGTPTDQVTHFRLSLKPVREMYGPTLAREFGPLKLKAVRENMVASGVSRGVVNHRVRRIKMMFGWGVENELVPAGVWHALLAVKGLQKGRTIAPDHDPVKPVPDEHVDAILPYLAPPLRAMVELQSLTGMRPGEVCRMRAEDLDRSAPIWLYRPHHHKNAWRGKDRVIAIGPKAQAVLEPFLTAHPEGYLFRPIDVMRHWSEVRRAARQTKVQPSQVDRRVPERSRPPGERYLTCAYAHCIVAACQKAGVPGWRPNRLRHAHATKVRKVFGLESAQASLGHARMDVTQVYAEKNLDLAAKVAEQLG